tara:strand:+ start:417 stop:1304 length:888 start_codon:yes stop_codon:yes gene_type:complete
MQFSIIIPTYKNYDYLKMCINSIKKNSTFKHEIIVHINGIDKETESFLTSNHITYTKSNSNLGLCTGVNIAAKKSIYEFIVYAHDDMYFCPKWDFYLIEEIKQINNKYFYLSSTQISSIAPLHSSKINHIFFDCGDEINNFNENKLLENFSYLKFHDLQGSHWAPHVIPKDLWKEIEGFSEEFNPGFGSDPDLNMKLWSRGVRIFKGINKSRVYHFGSQTTRKNKDIVKNNANKTFLLKWGITIEFFVKFYLKRGNVYKKDLDDFKINIKNFFPFIFCKIKFILTKFLYLLYDKS